MTLEEKLEKFKSGTVALHPLGQKNWEKLMWILDEQGYVWITGNRPSTALNWWNDHTYLLGRDEQGHKCISDHFESVLIDQGIKILEISDIDFTTVESIMESIDEIKTELESCQELFKKYDVVMPEAIELSMRKKIKCLLETRVVY